MKYIRRISSFPFSYHMHNSLFFSNPSLVIIMQGSGIKFTKPRFQNGGTRSHRSHGLLFRPSFSVSLVGISLSQRGKYLFLLLFHLFLHSTVSSIHEMTEKLTFVLCGATKFFADNFNSLVIFPSFFRYMMKRNCLKENSIF